MKHLKKAAAKLDDYGRNGDTIVAHLNPREAALLKLLGGSGTTNPKTGLLEFFSETDPMGSGSDYGYGEGKTDADRAASENATNSMVGAMNAASAAPAPPMFYEEDAQKAQYQPRDFFTRARDYVGLGIRDKIQDIKDNPVRSAINGLVSMTPVGGLNTVMGFVNPDLTVGGAFTGMGRAATGYSNPSTQVAEKDVGKTEGAIGPSGDKSDNEGPASGTADAPYDPTKSGPSGSGLSPLAQALAGMGIRNDGWNNWGRRKTLGPLVSSYDPNGRQYVTPWDYRV